MSADEIIDIVDEQDRVTGQSPRGEAYRLGLRHRCACVFVTDGEGRAFVHRRTPTKQVYPSQYDMFVGGVVAAGESYDAAALREAGEELGVTGLPQPAPLFKFLYESEPGSKRHSWWLSVYEVRCDVPVRPQVEEVEWYGFLTQKELAQRLGEWEWVPDGRAAYDRLRELRGGLR